MFPSVVLFPRLSAFHDGEIFMYVIVGITITANFYTVTLVPIIVAVILTLIFIEQICKNLIFAYSFAKVL